MNHYMIKKPEHGSNEWLYLRHRNENGQTRIAASEAAAVHGEHRFITKYGLAVAKMAEHPEVTEQNRAMERGNRLEPTLLRWLGDEIGVELGEPKSMFALDAPNYWLIATLDGVDEESSRWDCPPKVVAEIKTYNREWTGELPPYWYWQGVQQAMCADVNEIIWGIFDRTLDLHVHHQKVSDSEKELHAAACSDFLWFVHDLRTIPAEWPATYDEIQRANLQVAGPTADITEHAQLIARLREVQANKKLLSDEEDQLKASIGSYLAGMEAGLVNGEIAVTWKQQSRKAFNTKQFEQDHPHLYELYQTNSTYRVMRLKGEK